MSIPAGTRFGTYEIVSLIGSGGMGEVYRAHDRALGRDVAIKVLRETFTGDPNRAARFEQEAKTLALLNHANIAHIYGLERTESTTALAMELVEGSTLAERIAQGRIDVEEAVRISEQIVDALEVAHEHGVVHRDLKPANIKLKSDGTVKVLDFGIAKALDTRTTGPGPAALTTPAMTETGVVLGTAAYMSPEQARGKPVDQRADIWAFGCVLYEMLTGDSPFARETPSDTVAAILESAPRWSALPPLSTGMNMLLRWCLEKPLKDRLQTIGDARRLLADEAAPQTIAPARSARAGWSLASAALIALAFMSWLHLRGGPVPPAAAETRLDLVTGATSDPFSFALSPDGQRIVFAAAENGVQHLWFRSLNSATARSLPGTEAASFPFWSTDGGAIAFWADGKLKRIDVETGSPRIIVAAAPRGGSWNKDGSILFAQSSFSPLFVVHESGGEVTPVTSLDDRQLSHRFPQFLPDGKRFVFFAQGAPAVSGIYLGSLDNKSSKRLTAADSAGVYAAGWLLFVRGGSLLARQLDLQREELTGETVTVADSVAFDPYRQASAVATSAGGLIAYRSGAATRQQLTWFDRTGNVAGVMGSSDDGAPTAPRLSPDGRRTAAFRMVQQNADVWIVDSDRKARFTFDDGLDRFPIWSPDGTRIAFQSNRKSPNDLYQKFTSLAAEEELLVASDQEKQPTDWSPDGRVLSYSSFDANTSWDIWMLPLDPGSKPFPFLKTAADERALSFSHDGRWVAYLSNASGRYEVYARPFPGPGAERQISSAGGLNPVWSANNTELYYLALDGKLMAASVSFVNGALEPGRVQALFGTRMYGGVDPNVGRNFDVSSDGRFLINYVLDNAVPITLIQNWREHDRAE